MTFDRSTGARAADSAAIAQNAAGCSMGCSRQCIGLHRLSFSLGKDEITIADIVQKDKK